MQAFPVVPQQPKAPVQQNHHHQEYAHLIFQQLSPAHLFASLCLLAGRGRSVCQRPSHRGFESNLLLLNHRVLPRRCLWLRTPCLFDAQRQACHQTVSIPIQNSASAFLLDQIILKPLSAMPQLGKTAEYFEI
jgi:hypothetical protein